jgi:hypothetical protein
MEEWRCNSISHNRYETCLYAFQCCKMRRLTFVLSDTQTNTLLCFRIPLINFRKKTLWALLTYRRDLISVLHVFGITSRRESDARINICLCRLNFAPGPTVWWKTMIVCRYTMLQWSCAVPIQHSAALCILHTNCSLLWSSWEKKMNSLLSWSLAVLERRCVIS